MRGVLQGASWRRGHKRYGFVKETSITTWDYPGQLHIDSQIFSAYTLSEDSQIGICVPGMEDSYTIIDSGNYAQGNLSKLFCDKGGYCLALGDGTSVVMTKGIASYASIPDEYNGKPLLRATFGFSTAAGAMADATAACYYSDGYFMSGDDYSGDPHDYNEHLATMSLAMAMAAFGCNEGGNDYTNKAKHIKQLFSDIGMQDIYLNQFFKEQPGADSMGGQWRINAFRRNHSSPIALED